MKKPSIFRRLYWKLPRWLKEPWYWFRCHTYNRYHIVDCRNNEYKWGWSDVDYLMLCACFELLRRYVENENGLDDLEFQGRAFRADAEKEWHSEEDREWLHEEAVRRDATYNEVKCLWHWWTIERPVRSEANPRGRDYDAEYEKDTEMLQRLIAVRGSLWT